MRVAEDPDGKRYVVVKRSGSSSLVRDPATGAKRYVDNAELRVIGGASPLVGSAAAVPDSVRAELERVPDERSLGLLVELADRGPQSVRSMLDRYDLCESDLYARLVDLRAAGLIVPRDVAGERGYAIEPGLDERLARLRSE